jgi:serine phosphatase RsbU (regulator of sigma subunit)
LVVMPDPHQELDSRRLADRLLAPSSRFQRYRWLVLLAASVLEVALVMLVEAGDSVLHPLDPVGAGIIVLSILAAGLSGTLAGLGTALVGVVSSFVILADFSGVVAASNAAASATLWCVAAIATGLTVGYLRRQVARRQIALEQALGRSLSAREKLERVLDFTPQFHLEGDLAAVSATVCQTAVDTFGSDSARLYSLEGSTLTLLALAPPVDKFKPGLTFALEDYPNLDEALLTRRPSYVRDVRRMGLKGVALRLQIELPIVSAVRIPIIGATGVIGLLSLSWGHSIGRPTDELLAIMQRFADQASLAWQNALRVEAQQQAEELRRTLDRVLALAPSFHISGAREEVAEAICEAALATFDCSAAALYRIEGDQLRILARLPQNEGFAPGLAFPLGGASVVVHELRSRAPAFIPDVLDLTDATYPWPPEVVRQTGMRSALYVPLRLNELGPRNLLVLAWDQPRERVDENLMVVVQRFADQAALALTNASAVQLHARLEASLLPARPTIHPHLRIVTRYRTGERRLRLGGDFVGTTVSDDGSLSFVIGDVSGHGPNAAALGATLRTTWRALTLVHQDLNRILEVMGSVLLNERTGPNAFATLLAGTVHPGSRGLTLTSAGHLPPILIADGDAVPLETPPSPPLGFADPSKLKPTDFALPEAWTLMCYTDGIIEARVTPGSGERFGEGRLRDHLRSWPNSHADEHLLDLLMQEIEAGYGGPFADDVAVLLISTKNSAAGTA